MWWRFLTFCVLVSFVLFVVLSCIHGRPVIHLFFHRCCEEDIENDQVIFENFGNNFLRERLVGADIVVDDNDSFVSDVDVEEVIKAMRAKLNVHDPKTRAELDVFPVNDNETSNELYLKVKELTNELQAVSEFNVTGNSENFTFNDVLSESEEINTERKLTKNDVLRELDSDEKASAEMTTASTAPITKVTPSKLIEFRELNNQNRRTESTDNKEKTTLDLE